MNVPYRVYDVFAESPFAGTQIAVVLADADIDERLKVQIAAEFNHSDTVFVDTSNKTSPFSVYNERGKTGFGAHTTLAAAQTAHELGMSRPEDGYFEYELQDNGRMVDTFVDNNMDNSIEKPASKQSMALYSRTFDFTTDRYVPELSSIADALAVDVKHLAYARYKPRLVRVDTPVLVVPMTRPEHVLAARLDSGRWSSLLSEIYASYILLIARGSVSGRADFHGRLMHPELKPNEYPPIGSVIPEFIAYLCSCEETSRGTHTVTIDRGGHKSRQSLIRAEFDYTGGSQVKCRIGGRVLLMAEGSFVYAD